MEEEIERDMTPILIEDLGVRFPTEKSKHKARYGLYQCQYCGKEFECLQQNVKKGNTKSCGCQSVKFKNPHGLRYHRLYDTWRDMKGRCYNPKSTNYTDYGGRGIKVCDRWLDIKNFIEDMYPSYQEGLTLDRIDVNGNYEPDNCRWTTKEVQNRNNRQLRITNTSGFRGVSWYTPTKKWVASIRVNTKSKNLGYYSTALEAAKVYETYVRLNNLEHNFTPALTEDEISELKKHQALEDSKCYNILE